MSRSRRQRFVDFETRSVQLIAACTLSLAGLASMPNAMAARLPGQVSPFPSSQASPADENGTDPVLHRRASP